jgi:outer membrane protein
MNRLLAVASACLLTVPNAAAQNEIRIEAPAAGHFNWLTQPYRARSVTPIRLNNSNRFETLTRAGILYLTAQDVVALAIENNIDVEIQRYGPLLAREVLKRAQAGGALRSVGAGIAAGPQSVSLQGVSLNASGDSSAGGGVGSGGGIVTQLGPALQSLDPTITALANFQHATSPQSNTVLTGTTALVQTTRSYQAGISKFWEYGLNAQLTYSSNHIHVNSQFFALDPFTNGSLDLQITQNLLQGFGSAVNTRNIRVQKNNLKISDLQFRQQVITTVSAVLNLYWDLVSFGENVRSRRQSVSTAQQLFDDNKRQVELGSLAEIEVTRAESQLYAAKQDLVIAETNYLQQETVLKNALSRGGVAAAGLEMVRIVPLDRIAMPQADDLKPVDELVKEAGAHRPDVEQSRTNLESNKINLVGIRNGLKPTLQAFAEFTNNGLTGDLNPLVGNAAGLAYLVGGYGNLLAQIARRNYPNYSAGFSLNIPLRNRAAQSDYVTSQLELRQNELNYQKSLNQVRVDVQNAVIGLEQARSRYDAALKSRQLQEIALSNDQKKYSLGATAAYQVVQDQRDLATAINSEVQAMANYTHARISLDQALGRTLEVNAVTINDAVTGRSAYQSVLGDNLPKPDLPRGGSR